MNISPYSDQSHDRKLNRPLGEKKQEKLRRVEENLERGCALLRSISRNALLFFGIVGFYSGDCWIELVLKLCGIWEEKPCHLWIAS